MRHYANEEFMDDAGFPFRAFRAPLDGSIDLHIHDFVEIIYVTEGHGIHLFEERQYPISEGDIFIIKPHVPHGYLMLPDTPLVVNNVIFDPVFFEQELAYLSGVTAFIDFYYIEPFIRETGRFQSMMNLAPAERIEAIQMLDRLVREDTHREANYDMMIRTELLQLFIFLSRCYERWSTKPMSSVEDERMRFRTICSFIEQHYAQPLSLQQVSQLCGLSQTTFTTKFKQHIGKTFLEFRNDIRMKAAKSLLETSSEKIMAIALEVGFDDLSFFNRTFKKHAGLSPGQYRQLHRQRMKP